MLLFYLSPIQRKCSFNMTNMIKILRIRKGMTQEELSKKLGVTKHSVQKYENGSIVNLKADTIRTLCDLFKVPPAFFIYEYEELTEAYLDTFFAEQFYEKLTGDSYYRTTIVKISSLNTEGLNRVNDYIGDLLKINEYKERV